MIGKSVGPYQILAELGRGGMGEVYRARDTRLGRDVAVKVLPGAFAHDTDRLARFEREARSIAALSHQNILAIHDTGTHDGQMFVVTELLTGETLRARVQQGPMPVRKATDIAMQIARGLAAAHDKGIIHRDLKPENVFLREDGQVKILDFGLARPMTTSSGATETVAAVTDPGTVMGTVGYMAPEQVRGLAVDARTDIFALGTVLYEMLSGHRAFKGDTAADAMIAIVKEDPPELAVLRPDVPPALHRIVRHCLEKNPVERFQSARDVAFALESSTDSGATSVHEALSSGTSAAPASRSRVTLGIIIGIAAAVLLAVGFAWRAGVFRSPSNVDATPPIVIGTASQLTTDDGLEIDPAISPDGKLLAYAAGKATQMRIFIRPVGGGRTIPLSDDKEAFEYHPRWSPDGNQILYLTPNGAFVASAMGGTSRKVVSGRLGAAAWSPDGKQLLFARGPALVVAQLDGSGERALVTTPDPLHSCDWSPKGGWIACVRGNLGSVVGNTFGNIGPSALVLIPAAGGTFTELTKLTALNQCPVWSPDGRQLYFVSTRQGPRDIYVLDIAEDGSAKGEPRRISTGLGAQSIAFSADRLVYVSYTARANIWSLPIPTSGIVDTSGARALTNGNQVIESLRVSRDGQWLLYDSTLHLNADIFRLPLAGGPPEQLTTDPSDDFAPDLSPDGREVAYHSFRSGSRDIFISPIAGGPAKQITATDAQESFPIWSPDGRALAFINQRSTKNMAVGLYLTRRDAAGSWSPPIALRLAAGIRGMWLTNEQFLAANTKGTIELIGTDAGPARVVYAPSRPGDPKAENVMVAADGRTAYFKSHDAEGRASIWAMPVAGGQPRQLVRFEDLSHVSIRADLAAGAGKFFFTLEDRQADIWMADISRRANR